MSFPGDFSLLLCLLNEDAQWNLPQFVLCCVSAALGGRRAPLPPDVQTLHWHRTGCTRWEPRHRVPLWVRTSCAAFLSYCFCGSTFALVFRRHMWHKGLGNLCTSLGETQSDVFVFFKFLLFAAPVPETSDNIRVFVLPFDLKRFCNWTSRFIGCQGNVNKSGMLIQQPTKSRRMKGPGPHCRAFEETSDVLTSNHPRHADVTSSEVCEGICRI